MLFVVVSRLLALFADDDVSFVGAGVVCCLSLVRLVCVPLLLVLMRVGVRAVVCCCVLVFVLLCVAGCWLL